jgi:hypothetical protein
MVWTQYDSKGRLMYEEIGRTWWEWEPDFTWGMNFNFGNGIRDFWNNNRNDLLNLASAGINLARQYYPQSQWLRYGRWGSLAVNAGLTANAWHNGQPWGWHAYNTGLSGVSLFGWQGTVIAFGIDGMVRGGMYFIDFVNYLNSIDPRTLMPGGGYRW